MKKLLFILLVGLIWAIPVESQSKITPINEGTKSITVSGQWEHPTICGVNDGELHVSASGGSGFYAYYLYRPNGTYSAGMTGHFYGLSDGWHWFEVYDFVELTIHSYPGTWLFYPTARPTRSIPANKLDELEFGPTIRN